MCIMNTTQFSSLWHEEKSGEGNKKTGNNRQQLVLPTIFSIFYKYYPLSKIYFCKIQGFLQHFLSDYFLSLLIEQISRFIFLGKYRLLTILTMRKGGNTRGKMNSLIYIVSSERAARHLILFLYKITFYYNTLGFCR